MYRTIIFVILSVACVESAEWAYSGETGPNHWADMEGSFCGDSSQSPIDIVPNDAVYREFEEFTMEGYNLEDDGGSPTHLTNNGHTAVVALEGEYKLTGGGLPSTFTAAQFHLHWGSQLDRGSEHTVSEKSYPAELHIVHFDSNKYADAGSAIAGGGLSLAVLGVFLEVGENENSNYKPFIDMLEAVSYKDDIVSLENDTFSVQDLLPNDVKSFFRYNGSLTTPQCNEVVIWTVFNEAVKISASQLEALRGLHEYEDGDENQHHLVDNYRPVQNLNNRVVYSSFETSSASVSRFSMLLFVICSIVLVTQLS